MQTSTKKLYKDSFLEIKEKFSYKNDLEVPRITAINLNVGVKAADSDDKILSYISSQLSSIAGQKAVLTKAKKSISTFKLREGMSIGCMVTLRGEKMYQFIDRLVNIALPRVRDFRGLSKGGFNQSFHYGFGLKEHNVFLEVNLDNIVKMFGININIATNAKSAEEALHLLKTLKFPIK